MKLKHMFDKAGIINQWEALCNGAGQAFCNVSSFLFEPEIKYNIKNKYQKAIILKNIIKIKTYEKIY